MYSLKKCQRQILSRPLTGLFNYEHSYCRQLTTTSRPSFSPDASPASTTASSHLQQDPRLLTRGNILSHKSSSCQQSLSRLFMSIPAFKALDRVNQLPLSSSFHRKVGCRNMSSGSKNKSASDTYQKLSQLEHVLKRPDSYVGSVEITDMPMWVCNASTNEMEFRTVAIVPGLYKIFDEILVNAADNKVRDPAMKNIKVTINSEDNEISVLNDGKGIPIEMHDTEKIYIPELIFGNLLTSSNYDDEEQKVTGGRNGFGAKLCNIFSTKFIVETATKTKAYKQVWRDNMTSVEPPEITKNLTGKSYTKITFQPDLKRFGMKNLDTDLISVLKRRVYDMAGTTKGVTVTLNDEVIPIADFKSYVNLFLKGLHSTGSAAENGGSSAATPVPPSFEPQILYAKPNDRWEIAFAVSNGEQFNQMSFVNSIATTAGGTHVTYITEQIINYINDSMTKKNKNSKSAKLQKSQIRNFCFVFVNCKITNPSFSSQTKEQLTSKVSAFGSKCEIPDRFLKDVYNKSGIITYLQAISDQNAANALSKSDGGKKRRLLGFSKLDDAAKAGTRESHKCTLILTEGDSAKALAVAGLAVVGRDYYGCYPLKGKVLNVRDASQDAILKNQEIQALKKIIGLQHNKRYTSVEGLRYGHIMVMTDQDHDGSHIKGLIINFIESSFPGLLDIPGFLVEFVTPIVKVKIKGGRGKGKEILFYSMPEFEHWREADGSGCTWEHKYYKGLGSSTPLEMKVYFGDIDKHEKKFLELQEGDHDRIELAFAKGRVEDRKQWLADFVPGTHLDPALTTIPIADFIDKELILFSMADNVRSIPSVIDGFKPGQRKVMWVSLATLKSSTKVQSLGGRVLERANYHHGPESLNQTIVGMAQDFVGTNNVYWLLPNGGFGSRAKGGKDSSAERYIETELNPITRHAFRKEDDALLTYTKESEGSAEPVWYVPTIPTLLVNGCEGIGTGWSTNIPSYNPEDIVDNIHRLLDDKPLKPMDPWYRGWTGEIQKVPGTNHQYRVCGRIEEIDETTLAITELPVKMWTQPMKEFLENCVIGASKGGDKKASSQEFIEEMIEEHRDDIRFIVKLSKVEMAKAKAVGLYNKFKLIAPLSTTNMVAFDPSGCLRKYDSPEAIMKEFYHVRLDFYNKRKEHLVNCMRWDLERLSAKARFIKMIIEGALVLSNKPRKVLVAELKDLKFPMFLGNEGQPVYPDSKVKTEEDPEGSEEPAVRAEDVEEEEEEDDTTGKVSKVKVASYNYLLTMYISSLTRERYEKLLKERGETEDLLNTTLSISVKDMWRTDLDDFMVAYRKFQETDVYNRSLESAINQGKKKGSSSRGSKRKGGDDDDDDFDGGSKPKRRRAVKKQNFADTVSTPIELPPISEFAVRAVRPAGKAKVKKEQKDSTPSLQSTAVGTPTEASGTKSPATAPAPVTPVQSVSPPDGDNKPSEKAPPKVAKTTKAKARANAIVDSDSEDEHVAPVSRQRSPRARRAATPSSMAIDSASSSGEEDADDSVFVVSD